NSRSLRPRVGALFLVAFGAVAAACSTDSVCDDGACDPEEGIEAGIDTTETTDTEAEGTAETQPDPTDIATEEPTDTQTEADSSMTEVMDAGEMMPEAGLMTPLDAGPDAMAPRDSGSDGGDASDEAGGGCLTCCNPANNHVDCDDP